MAIQMRRGLKKDLDPTKLLPGEWSVSIDSVTGNQMVWMCFAPGVVKQMGTYEDFKNMIGEITADIQSDMIDATIKANNAAAKANEAANAILDEKYIITTRETFSKEASVSPTSKGNVIIEKLGGDTYQKSYNGYQLFDASKFPTYSAGGATTTNNSDGSLTISGSGTLSSNFSWSYDYTHEETVNLIKAGKIKWSEDTISEPHIYATLYVDGSAKLTVLTKERTIAQEMLDNETTYLKIGWWAPSGTTITPCTIKPMLYQSGDGTWEPFTGGKPSPNPEAPQRIEAVGDKGWFDGELLQGKYSDTVGTPNNASGWVSPVNKMPCKSGDDVKLMYDTTATTMQLFFYDSGNNYVSHVTNGSASEISTTAPDRAEWFAFSIGTDLTPEKAGHITVTINGMYAVIVDSSSRNLFNAYKSYPFGTGSVNVENEGARVTVKGKYYASFPVDLKANTQYYISFKIGSSTLGTGVIFEYDDGTITTLKTASYAFTPSKNVRRAYLYSGTETEGTTVYKDFQIEKGAEQTAFNPYFHQRLYIPIGSPLKKYDYIQLNNGVYERVRGMMQIVLDGSESWEYITSNRNPCFRMTLPARTMTDTVILSSHFRYMAYPYTVPDAKNVLGTESSFTKLFIASELTDVNAWKAFLAEQYANGTPVKVVYQLAEPIIEPIRHKSLYELTATDKVTNISIPMSDNLMPENIFRFPRSEDGGLVTTNFADAKKNEIKLDELETKLANVMLNLV